MSPIETKEIIWNIHLDFFAKFSAIYEQWKMFYLDTNLLNCNSVY